MRRGSKGNVCISFFKMFSSFIRLNWGGCDFSYAFCHHWQWGQVLFCPFSFKPLLWKLLEIWFRYDHLFVRDSREVNSTMTSVFLLMASMSFFLADGHVSSPYLSQIGFANDLCLSSMLMSLDPITQGWNAAFVQNMQGYEGVGLYTKIYNAHLMLHGHVRCR